MTATSDEAALLAAIRANPGEDTPRLMYADWLDENAGMVACWRCGGIGADGWETHAGRWGNQLATPAVKECAACSGSGTVPDGRRERAEFIRVQVEIARTYGPPDSTTNGCCPSCDHPDGHFADCRLVELERRERELLHWWTPNDRRTGHVRWAPAVGNPYDHQFRRGLVEVVVCTAADWLTHGDAIAAAHPITRVRLTGEIEVIPASFGYNIYYPSDDTYHFKRWPGIVFEVRPAGIPV